MARIKLSELRPAGSELLQDSESFLNELSDRELDNIVGGTSVATISNETIITFLRTDNLVTCAGCLSFVTF